VNVCHVLSEDPDLAQFVAPEQRSRAVEHCVARTTRVPRGRWHACASERLREGIGLLVLEGLLLRRVGIDGRFGAELLGVGDLLRPWESDESRPTLTLTTGWRVLEPVRLAVLDDVSARRFAVYPQLTGQLVKRALERSRNLAINMAIVHQARVNVRLRMLFWHLADRFGKVTPAGVVVSIKLTHQDLSKLVGATRPSVTAALGELAEREWTVRRQDGSWLLPNDPPPQLRTMLGRRQRSPASG